MKFALRFAQDSGQGWTGFRESEFESLLQLYNLVDEVTVLYRNGDVWVIDGNQSSLELILSRSVLIKSAMRLFCFFQSRADMLENLESDDITRTQIMAVMNSVKSFKVRISTLNKTYTAKEKVEIIEDILCRLAEINAEIDLVSPDVSLFLVEDFDHLQNIMKFCYLGVEITCDERLKVMKDFSIKDRCFIGTTTMDPVLSALMSNIAKVAANDLVLDPFIGTGGVALLCGYHGGYIVGSDLDYKTIHATNKPSRSGLQGKRRHKNECIKTNFTNSGFEERFIDIFVNDAADDVWKSNLFFSSIVTDPPYGIRERIRTVNDDIKLTCDDSVPNMKPQSVIEMFASLITFAAKHLDLNGRLVFWMPTLTDRSNFDPEKHVPKHPVMKLAHVCSQTFTHTSSRCLICLEKVAEFSDKQVVSVCEDYYDLGDVRFREAYLNS